MEMPWRNRVSLNTNVECRSVKPLADVYRPDDRARHFGTLGERHDVLAAIVLHETVPDHVRELFDTARNLSLYSWCVYDFHPIADLTGFLALEAAVKARAARQSPELAMIKSFRKLMDKALENGWIAEDRIAGRRAIARARVADRKALDAIGQMNEAGMDSMPVEEPTEEEITQEERGMRIIASICEAGVKIRNSLAHGERTLTPGSERRLRMTADLINQLFP